MSHRTQAPSRGWIPRLFTFLRALLSRGGGAPRKGLALAAAVLTAGLLPADGQAQEFRLVGQLRPRYEARDPKLPSAPVGDVAMRARLGVVATLPESVTLRAEFQDVVVWGASASTPGAAPAPELFVAYAEFGNLFGSESSIRVGRQEISLGNQRLLSNNNWGHRGGRLDGVRLTWRGDSFPVDLFSARLSEAGTGTGSDAWFNGAYTPVPIRGSETLSLYALHSRARGTTSTDQFTVGGHTQIEVVGFGWIGEGYFQFGERADADVSAHMFAVGATRTFGRLRTQLLYEVFSGNVAGESEVGVFDKLRGSNHGFHGYADLFTNIPDNTDGHGLRDLNLRTTFAASGSTDVQVNGHVFRADEPDGLSSHRYGDELDLVVTHRPRSGVTLEGGVARVFAGPGLADVRDVERDLTWVYAMFTLVF